MTRRKRRPLALDLYCGAGGAGVGYERAGFDVVGVDIVAQPNYPFSFVQMNALNVENWALIDEFDVVHASPPCQAYLALTSGTNKGRKYPKLIEYTRTMLHRLDIPYVIECPMRWPLVDPIRLCGESFGLSVIRHRFFESNLGRGLVEPTHIPHRGRVAGMRHGKWYEGPYFAVYGDGGGKGSIAQWREAMGIDWMTKRVELAEAIPPAYTECIGRQLIKELGL